MVKPNAAQQAFTQNLPLCQALGMEVTDVDEGTATLIMPYSPELIGDPTTGVIHGGAVSALMDSASGLAVYMHPENKGHTATIDLRIDYMRPAAPNKSITAHAEVYHATRSVAFLRATAWTDDRNRPIAQATGAFVFTKKKKTS
ncbi:thioesterase [Amylibacter ulvae]|uniref:Thioesterase n=1 Tax=Paramylibacter ulvae TaxID=1651968 RepID=A0ABQ3D5G5_9RHOB|nr:PaaI family thioesterase [Amylibacter ulvae]GHA57662.1 thioesterase [Amylibacter ulvae]